MGDAPPPAYTDVGPPGQAMPQPTAQPMAQPMAQADDGRWILSYVDFTPTCLQQGGFLSMPVYEEFSALVQKANGWLQQNPSLKAKVCESLEVKATNYGSGFVDTNSPMYYESGKMASFFIRCLRLWVVPKESYDNPAPQQIGFLNVVPGCTSAGGMLSMPTFEGYGETINKINQMFQQQPLQGRILNVETQDIKFSSWGGNCNPDITFWRESGQYNTFFLNVIRIFYEAGPPCHEQIGSVDFVPARTSMGGLVTMGSFEPLSALLGHANQWMQQNPALPVTNVQSIEYKLSQSWGGERLDTQRTLFRESGKFSTFYVRILRVYYVHASGGPPRQPLRCLSYKTFVPHQLTAGGMLSMPQFELQNQTMKRAMAWLKATNAKVIGCETVPVKFYGAWGRGLDTEATYIFNSGRHAEHYIFVLRVYLDGYYQEPPAEMLPPAPVIAQSSGGNDCCTIL